MSFHRVGPRRKSTERVGSARFERGGSGGDLAPQVSRGHPGRFSSIGVEVVRANRSKCCPSWIKNKRTLARFLCVAERYRYLGYRLRTSRGTQAPILQYEGLTEAVHGAFGGVARAAAAVVDVLAVAVPLLAGAVVQAVAGIRQLLGVHLRFSGLGGGGQRLTRFSRSESPSRCARIRGQSKSTVIFRDDTCTPNDSRVPTGVTRRGGGKAPFPWEKSGASSPWLRLPRRRSN